MIDYKTIFGILASLVAAASYVAYFHGIFVGKTKPHAFTWLVWATLNAIGFAILLFDKGGTGVWALGITCLCNYTVAGIGFYQKRVKFSRFDWLSLLGAVLAITLWVITKNPLWAAILISLTDILGLLPSVRKAFKLPFEENASSFALGAINFTLTILAFQEHNLTNMIYPVGIVVADVGFTAMILLRRQYLKNNLK